MMLYLIIYYEFFKIGLFAIGGGYATLPFLYYLSEKYNWFQVKELTDMIAVSNITPGPIGINMATYAGYKIAGVLGSIIATIAIITPALIIVMLIIKLLKQFKESKTLESILSGLRPAGCAMITAIGIKLFSNNILNVYSSNFKTIIEQFNLDYKALTLFILLLIISQNKKIDPLFYIFSGAAFGCIVYFFK